MLLRICVGMLCLAVTAIAQNDTDLPMAGDPIEERFEGAASVRSLHFYCLDLNGTFEERLNSSSILNPLQWAIFLQYPVLSYLDSQRKGALFRAIAQIVQVGGNNNLTEFNETDFCIANVTHYSVANYEESVLVQIYFQGITVFNPDEMGAEVSVAGFVAAFNEGFESEANSDTSSLVQSFEGRDAIVVMPLPGDDRTETELNQHPGFLSADAQDDPTRRAVFLGSYVGRTTIEEALNNRRSFAFNPDPTNFGLEAGDIVFAVFGSIFLAAVGALTLLGFCIHPFFLA